jgi:hypothetical protein
MGPSIASLGLRSRTATRGAGATCLPQTQFSTASNLFTDGTCTTPLNLVSMQAGCVPSGFPAAGTIAYVASCPPRIAHIGAP